jgi:hypothetical protein
VRHARGERVVPGVDELLHPVQPVGGHRVLERVNRYRRCAQRRGQPDVVDQRGDRRVRRVAGYPQCHLAADGAELASRPDEVRGDQGAAGVTPELAFEHAPVGLEIERLRPPRQAPVAGGILQRDRPVGNAVERQRPRRGDDVREVRARPGVHAVVVVDGRALRSRVDRLLEEAGDGCDRVAARRQGPVEGTEVLPRRLRVEGDTLEREAFLGLPCRQCLDCRKLGGGVAVPGVVPVGAGHDQPRPHRHAVAVGLADDVESAASAGLSGRHGEVVLVPHVDVERHVACGERLPQRGSVSTQVAPSTRQEVLPGPESDLRCRRGRLARGDGVRTHRSHTCRAGLHRRRGQCHKCSQHRGAPRRHATKLPSTGSPTW